MALSAESIEKMYRLLAAGIVRQLLLVGSSFAWRIHYVVR